MRKRGAQSATTGPAPGPRLLVGIAGLFVAAVMGGLNNRVGALALIDLRGGLGLGTDEGQWIVTVYLASELVTMLMAAWFSVTFSFRRFHIAMVVGCALLSALVPFAPNYGWLLVLRSLQGLFGGALVPLLIMGALRFFPLPSRLYGLALYALTATFTPNFALWVSPLWTDRFDSLSLVHWQAVPMAVFAIGAVWWGIPQDPVKLERFCEMDGVGLVTGAAALIMITIGLIEGERRDWFHSSLIIWLLGGGLCLFVTFLISEWYHSSPFVKLQLLERRNLWLNFTIFVALLIAVLSGSVLSADQLSHVQGFRVLQIAPIGLEICLPQLVLAPAMSFLLSRQWVDARRLFALGLLLIALSCGVAAFVSSGWMVREFALAQALQAVGQPMAIVSMLYLITSVVQPTEGPFVAGLVNGLRAIANLVGAALIGRLLVERTAAHQRGLVDRLGRIDMDSGTNVAALAGRIGHEAFTLAISDAYCALGLLALALIPVTFFIDHIPAPTAPPSSEGQTT